jgi:hypothetical protein
MDESPSTRPSSYPDDVEGLASLDEDTLIDEHGIAVDWKACDDEVVADFGGHLAPGDSLTARLDESDLYATYNGAEHPIPLTHSPADRYVVIGSLIAILGARYELRRFKSSVQSDTHVFLLLLREDWRRLEEAHRSWADSLFEPVPLGKDGFGGGEAVVKEPEAGGRSERRPWWRFW